MPLSSLSCVRFVLLVLLASVSPGAAEDRSLTGNAGTNPPANFLGTTDAAALELRVNGQRVLRLESTDPTFGGSIFPNLIGANFAATEVHGATIAGGGIGDPLLPVKSGAPGPNRITDDFGTADGGDNNEPGEYFTVLINTMLGRYS